MQFDPYNIIDPNLVSKLPDAFDLVPLPQVHWKPIKVLEPKPKVAFCFLPNAYPRVSAYPSFHSVLLAFRMKLPR